MGISGRIARFFLDSQLTPLIALVALLLGLFAVLVTPREEEPQINVTMANVFIPFPGASAKDVEALVSTPAEQVLARISGIDHVYSVSRPGMAVLTAQFKVGIAHESAVVRLMDTIQSRRDWVSTTLGVGEPIIKPMGIDDVPVVTLTLWTQDLFHKPLVEQFIQAVGVFPVGSLIELSTGEVAVVIKQSKVRRLPPRVLVICGPDKVPAPTFRVMELLYQADKDAKRVYIARGLPAGAYGLDAHEYYLA